VIFRFEFKPYRPVMSFDGHLEFHSALRRYLRQSLGGVSRLLEASDHERRCWIFLSCWRLSVVKRGRDPEETFSCP